MLKKRSLVPLALVLTALCVWACKTTKRSPSNPSPAPEGEDPSQCAASLALASASDWEPTNLDPNQFGAMTITARSSSFLQSDVLVDFNMPSDLAKAFPDFALIQACGHGSCDTFFRDFMTDVTIFSSIKTSAEYVQAKACFEGSRLTNAAKAAGKAIAGPGKKTLYCADKWSNQSPVLVSLPSSTSQTELARAQEKLEGQIRDLAGDLHTSMLNFVKVNKLTKEKIKDPKSFKALVYAVSQMPFPLYSAYVFSPTFDQASANMLGVKPASASARLAAGDNTCVKDDDIIDSVDDEPTPTPTPAPTPTPTTPAPSATEDKPTTVTAPTVNDAGEKTCPAGQKLADPTNSGVMLCWENESPQIDPSTPTEVISTPDVLYPGQRDLTPREDVGLLAGGGALIGIGAIGMIVASQFLRVSYQQGNLIEAVQNGQRITADQARRYFSILDFAEPRPSAFFARVISEFDRGWRMIDQRTGKFILQGTEGMPVASTLQVAEEVATKATVENAKLLPGKLKSLKVKGGYTIRLDNGKKFGERITKTNVPKIDDAIFRTKAISYASILAGFAAVTIGSIMVSNGQAKLASSALINENALRTKIERIWLQIVKLKSQYLINGLLIHKISQT